MLTARRRVLPLLLLATFPDLCAAQAGVPANGPQLNIAHRGASAYAPEHTFFAYDLAMAMDVDMLECDLLLTQDEVPVCIHDETVDRTSGGSATGRVDSYTLAELRQMDFGSWFNLQNPTYARPEYAGANIVPFEEQLDCYLRHNPRMRFHVETKDSADGRAEAVMVELLTRKGLIATGDLANGNLQSSTVLLQSFDATSLERMRELTPSIPTAFLMSVPNQTTAQWQLAGTGPDYIDAFAPNSAALFADPTAVQRYHANGHDVHTWTVNDAQQMGLLLDMGVDGIFTNNPDLLRAEIDARGTGTTPEERGNPTDFPRGCPGLAGRVTSRNGPGDVWVPVGTRGVRLATVTQPGPQPSAPPVTTTPATGRFGGAVGVSLLFGLLGGLLGRRRQRD